MNNYDDLLNNVPAEEQRILLSKAEYAEMKKAEREDIYALSGSTALEVAKDGSRFRQYLDTQSCFDRYSAVNTLLIMAQKPDATRLADFGHWKERGGYVKPGQTGISILEPHEYTKEGGSSGTGYNIKKVFDISQVDVRNVKKVTPPTYTNRQLLTALVAKAHTKITSTTELPDNAGAMTDPTTGEISVRKGMEFADTFICLAQELGYYEADRDADKIPLNPSFVGYCAAYMLCKKHGIDTNSFNFDKAPEVFRGLNAQVIKQELSIIRDAASSIGERMSKNLESISKAARDAGEAR